MSLTQAPAHFPDDDTQNNINYQQNDDETDVNSVNFVTRRT